MGSRTTDSVRATRGTPTQDGTNAIHGSCAILFLFSWFETERLSGRAVITSLVSMCSIWAGSRSVRRCVLRVLRSQEHTIKTNALCVSHSSSNVLSSNVLSINHKEKLCLEQRSDATDFRSKGHRVSTCSFPTNILFRFWPLSCTHHTQWDHINIKRFLSLPSSKHRPSVGPREDTTCPQSSFVSSVQVMSPCLTESQSPDFISASRNGLQAISLWAAAWDGRPPGKPQRCSTLLWGKWLGKQPSTLSSRPLPCYSVQYSTVRISSRLLFKAALAIPFHCSRPKLALTSSARCPRTRQLPLVCDTYLYVSL